MGKLKKTFDICFEADDLIGGGLYSEQIVKSLSRSILEPIAAVNPEAIVLCRLKDIEETNSLIKRLEYSTNIFLKEFSDFDFSRFDVDETGFIVINAQRYNCAFLFKEIEKDKYKIYLKLNSKLVFDVYEIIKSMFSLNLDEKFYKFKPERRENAILNKTIDNFIKHYEETILENEYNTQIQQNYKSVNVANTTFRNEIYQNVKQIAHEIKNQLSILDIYTRIFEKKTNDSETVEPIKKSIALIKNQIEQFKNIDVINLQERDVKKILQEAIKNYANLLKEKNNKLILIDEMAGFETNTFLDEEKFSIVVNNIIKNAHDSTSNDEIIIKILKADDKVKIQFINHGEMIETKNQSKIFETGYTTKTDGWGIGLAVCKKFIGSQFGTLELIKSDKEETIFQITLKLANTK